MWEIRTSWKIHVNSTTQKFTHSSDGSRSQISRDYAEIWEAAENITKFTIYYRTNSYESVTSWPFLNLMSCYFKSNASLYLFSGLTL